MAAVNGYLLHEMTMRCDDFATRLLILFIWYQVIRATETQVLVAILGKDLTLAAELVSELWDAKIKAEFGLTKRVMNHITRAKQSGIPWMVIVGESELLEGVVKLKNIEANEEEAIQRDKIVEELQRRLSINWKPHRMVPGLNGRLVDIN